MADSAEKFERRISELRAAIRHSVMTGDQLRAGRLRADLRQAERSWEDALAAMALTTKSNDDESRPGTRSGRPPVVVRQGRRSRADGPLLTVREHVHHALTLLTVPAAPRLIIEVHGAFLGSGEIADARLTHQRRDEERSFRTAPYARPYYLCAALTAEQLTPARGLLALSTWPLERRIVGPLSSRVDFLTAAVRIAEQMAAMPDRGAPPGPAATRLLWRFAANIAGAADSVETMSPARVAGAARGELAVHEATDWEQRVTGADRARRLPDAERLFGVRLTGRSERSG
jgi:hypothetical protein